MSARETLQRFVDDFCRNGSKTGRADYIRCIPLDRLEELRVALAEEGIDWHAPMDATARRAEREARERLLSAMEKMRREIDTIIPSEEPR